MVYSKANFSQGLPYNFTKIRRSFSELILGEHLLWSPFMRNFHVPLWNYFFKKEWPLHRCFWMNFARFFESNYSVEHLGEAASFKWTPAGSFQKFWNRYFQKTIVGLLYSRFLVFPFLSSFFCLLFCFVFLFLAYLFFSCY